MAFNGQELGFSEKEGDSGQCSVSVSLSRPRPWQNTCSGWSGPPRAVGQGRTTEGALHPSRDLLESPPLPLTPAPKRGRIGGAEPREGKPRAGLVWGEEAGELAAAPV